MKKKLFLSLLLLAFILPLSSFTASVTHTKTSVKPKQASIFIGVYTRLGINYNVYGDSVTGLINRVSYVSGGLFYEAYDINPAGAWWYASGYIHVQPTKVWLSPTEYFTLSGNFSTLES